nr:hypothetical protein [Tanacetum cinerariifolium]
MSIKDIDDLTRCMEAGACEDVFGGINKDERNTIMDAIMDLCGKFLDTTSDNEYSPKEKFSTDMSNLADYSFGKEHPANVYISFIPNSDMPIVHFARCLIEVRDDAPLKDSVTIGIPLSYSEGFTKEMVQVQYSNVDKMNNGGFQMVVNKRKSGKTSSTIYNRSDVIAGKATWQPIKQKVSYEPKAHGNFPKNIAPNVSNFVKDYPFNKMLATKGGRHVPTSKPSVPTSNPYDVLVDIEIEEEAEVIYDKTVILKDAGTRSSPFVAPDGS